MADKNSLLANLEEIDFQIHQKVKEIKSLLNFFEFPDGVTSNHEKESIGLTQSEMDKIRGIMDNNSDSEIELKYEELNAIFGAYQSLLPLTKMLQIQLDYTKKNFLAAA